MQSCLNTITSVARYDDGFTNDYSMMIRLWSSFNRSVSDFNRRCGVMKTGSRTSAKLAHDGKKIIRSK